MKSLALLLFWLLCNDVGVISCGNNNFSADGSFLISQDQSKISPIIPGMNKKESFYLTSLLTIDFSIKDSTEISHTEKNLSVIQ